MIDSLGLDPMAHFRRMMDARVKPEQGKKMKKSSYATTPIKSRYDENEGIAKSSRQLCDIRN